MCVLNSSWSTYFFPSTLWHHVKVDMCLSLSTPLVRLIRTEFQFYDHDQHGPLDEESEHYHSNFYLCRMCLV